MCLPSWCPTRTSWYFLGVVVSSCCRIVVTSSHHVVASCGRVNDEVGGLKRRMCLPSWYPTQTSWYFLEVVVSSCCRIAVALSRHVVALCGGVSDEVVG